MRRKRPAARVVLLDRTVACLMINSSDPADRSKPPWWEIPGGGMDPGESSEEAARARSSRRQVSPNSSSVRVSGPKRCSSRSPGCISIPRNGSTLRGVMAASSTRQASSSSRRSRFVARNGGSQMSSSPATSCCFRRECESSSPRSPQESSPTPDRYLVVCWGGGGCRQL